MIMLLQINIQYLYKAYVTRMKTAWHQTEDCEHCFWKHMLLWNTNINPNPNSQVLKRWTKLKVTSF